MSNIIAGLTLVVTGIYAYLTYRIVKASKQQVEALIRPFIVVTHRLTNQGLIRLYIKNTGKMAAENLQLTIDGDYFQIARKDYNIAENFVFKNTVASFPPESELTFALTPTVALQQDEKQQGSQPRVFSITASYGYLGKSVAERTTVDLRVYDKTFMPDPSIQDKLEKLTEALVDLKRRIVNGDSVFGKVRRKVEEEGQS
jgi:hypothetical protein